MSTRLALTPAIGLFAGLSMVSFGAVSMLLTGVHGSPPQATNPCSASATAVHTTAAGTRSRRSDSGTQAGQAARLPVLLDAAVQAISSPTPSPAPSTSPPAPPSPPPVTPNPRPGGGNVTPSPGNPNPGSTTIATPDQGSRSTPPISPGGINKTPTATPTPTQTATPTPTSTATPPPAATLCLSVQTLGGSSTVDPGGTVQYAIWVWLTSGTGGTAKISIDASPNEIVPTFSVCQPTGGSTCSVAGLRAGQHVEAQATLTARKDLAGQDIKLSVTATSTHAANSASASDTVRVGTKDTSSSPTPTQNAGNGGVLPPAGLPGGGGNSFPGVTNPAGNLGTAFPQVSPSPNTSPRSPRHQHQVRLTDLSAGLPLTVRLIGGQVIGLAILAAAVTIAVARLSLRRQPPRHGDDSASSTPST